MSGSNPDAALYWMAKMLTAGEDPRFIARRIVICASEDVGNATRMRFMLAVAALNAVEFVGMPEGKNTACAGGSVHRNSAEIKRVLTGV